MNDKLYIIALKDGPVSEENIFTIKAKNKEEAIRKYAEDYLLKTDSFKSIVEDRSVKGTYYDYFFKGIYDLDMSEGCVTKITDNKIALKIKENIKSNLGEYQQYTEMLFNFYQDDSKSMNDLDHELLIILALKNIYEELKHYLIKEVII